MAIKAGQILTIGKQFLIDRIQTGGPGTLTIPEERIYELGNRTVVGLTRDRADLSFDLETLDMSAEVEAILTNADPTTITTGQVFDFANARPIDIIGPYRPQIGTSSVRGVALPYLTLESASYRFGLRANAAESFSLRGDAVYYIPGTPYYSEFTVAAPVTGPYAFASTSLATNESGASVHALGVSVKRANGTYERLFFGADYTDTAASFTLTAAGAAKVAVGDKLCVVYGSSTPGAFPQTIHPNTTVKPAAVRGRNIDVYIGPQGGPLVRWAGVQSAEANWRVTLDADEEFGNAHAVSQDYDAPDVAGNVAVRAATIEYLFTLIAQVTNVGPTAIANVLGRTPLELEIRASDPVTGNRVKTLYVPDAIFQPPPLQGRVQQKLETTFPWTSETGQLQVISGARP